jgi:hypothetical protein
MVYKSHDWISFMKFRCLMHDGSSPKIEYVIKYGHTLPDNLLHAHKPWLQPPLGSEVLSMVNSYCAIGP